MIRISSVKLPLSMTPADFPRVAAQTLGLLPTQIQACRLVRKAVDARDKSKLHFVVTLDVQTDAEAALLARMPHLQIVCEDAPIPVIRREKAPSLRPLVVGAGPAGLFSALRLAQAGCAPRWIERGKSVTQRAADVQAFWAHGTFLPSSNVQFGEGGAGAFSDGKLTTGIKDPRCADVLRTLVECGAPEEILYVAKPHIGTDRLQTVVRNIRERICALGGEIRFETELTALHTDGQRLTHATLRDARGEETVDVSQLVLAIGHSARDTFTMLLEKGVTLLAKPFSIGVRIEHTQAQINRAQYGEFAKHPALHTADYKLAVHLANGRDVYTFCMCPGGSVVAAASEAGGVVTNGMSLYARDQVNANSAVLVGVTPADFSSDHPLAGMYFQQQWERLAFTAGGGDFRAPVQRVEDFLQNRASKGPGTVLPSYLPGVSYGDLRACLPPFLVEALRQGLLQMDRRLRGFATPDALLTGVETRSSSPVRIVRDETGQANIAGIYPAGEGAGYAGGILSAAVDGMRAADAVLAQI